MHSIEHDSLDMGTNYAQSNNLDDGTVITGQMDEDHSASFENTGMTKK